MRPVLAVSLLLAENAPMRDRILIADDTPEKLHAMRNVVAASRPDAVIDTAESIPKALEHIRMRGRHYCRSVIDFDFPRDRNVGSAIIRALRKGGNREPIVCATARAEGASFDEAAEDAMDAGANETLCFARDGFTEELRAFAA